MFVSEQQADLEYCKNYKRKINDAPTITWTGYLWCGISFDVNVGIVREVTEQTDLAILEPEVLSQKEMKTVILGISFYPKYQLCRRECRRNGSCWCTARLQNPHNRYQSVIQIDKTVPNVFAYSILSTKVTAIFRQWILHNLFNYSIQFHLLFGQICETFIWTINLLYKW